MNNPIIGLLISVCECVLLTVFIMLTIVAVVAFPTKPMEAIFTLGVSILCGVSFCIIELIFKSNKN